MILEYNDFLLEKQLVRSRRDLAISVFERLEEVQPILIEAVEMVELGIFDGFSLEKFANFTDEQLNENLFKVAKEKLAKAKETIKQKGKDALSAAQERIIKIGGDVSKDKMAGFIYIGQKKEDPVERIRPKFEKVIKFLN